MSLGLFLEVNVVFEEVTIMDTEVSFLAGDQMCLPQGLAMDGFRWLPTW